MRALSVASPERSDSAGSTDTLAFRLLRAGRGRLTIGEHRIGERARLARRLICGLLCLQPLLARRARLRLLCIDLGLRRRCALAALGLLLRERVVGDAL